MGRKKNAETTSTVLEGTKQSPRRSKRERKVVKFDDDATTVEAPTTAAARKKLDKQDESKTAAVKKKPGRATNSRAKKEQQAEADKRNQQEAAERQQSKREIEEQNRQQQKEYEYHNHTQQEEERLRKQEEDERHRQQEEEERHRQEQEDKRRQQEEEERHRQAQEEKRRQQEEEEQHRRQQQEQESRKQEEENQHRRQQQEQERRSKQQEEERLQKEKESLQQQGEERLCQQQEEERLKQEREKQRLQEKKQKNEPHRCQQEAERKAPSAPLKRQDKEATQQRRDARKRRNKEHNENLKLDEERKNSSLPSCPGCKRPVGPVHKCLRCKKNCHVFCGRQLTIEEHAANRNIQTTEGFGQVVVCQACDGAKLPPQYPLPSNRPSPDSSVKNKRHDKGPLASKTPPPKEAAKPDRDTTAATHLFQSPPSKKTKTTTTEHPFASLVLSPIACHDDSLDITSQDINVVGTRGSSNTQNHLPTITNPAQNFLMSAKYVHVGERLKGILKNNPPNHNDRDVAEDQVDEDDKFINDPAFKKSSHSRSDRHEDSRGSSTVHWGGRERHGHAGRGFDNGRCHGAGRGHFGGRGPAYGDRRTSFSSPMSNASVDEFQKPQDRSEAFMTLFGDGYDLQQDSPSNDTMNQTNNSNPCTGNPRNIKYPGLYSSALREQQVMQDLHTGRVNRKKEARSHAKSFGEIRGGDARKKLWSLIMSLIDYLVMTVEQPPDYFDDEAGGDEEYHHSGNQAEGDLECCDEPYPPLDVLLLIRDPFEPNNNGRSKKEDNEVKMRAKERFTFITRNLASLGRFQEFFKDISSDAVPWLESERFDIQVAYDALSAYKKATGLEPHKYMTDQIENRLKRAMEKRKKKLVKLGGVAMEEAGNSSKNNNNRSIVDLDNTHA